MKIKSFFVPLLGLILAFSLTGCEDVPADQAIDYEEDVKPLIEEKTNSAKSRGNCNLIAAGSTCLDYVGSLWTEQQMKLNCGDPRGTFSLNACPYSEVGGCRTGGGTIAETIIWSYDYGGDPITPEVKPYTMSACNALQIADWVTPAGLLAESAKQ